MPSLRVKPLLFSPVAPEPIAVALQTVGEVSGGASKTKAWLEISNALSPTVGS